jgi:hypothetical protein
MLRGTAQAWRDFSQFLLDSFDEHSADAPPHFRKEYHRLVLNWEYWITMPYVYRKQQTPFYCAEDNTLPNDDFVAV